mmetsp:Transcript_60543/g.192181  ORF Transcript_60543/g.192181 Transcript_60543/m.192181 type:complete len:256 (-) Transcript_60543:2465-3232(-)
MAASHWPSSIVERRPRRATGPLKFSPPESSESLELPEEMPSRWGAAGLLGPRLARAILTCASQPLASMRLLLPRRTGPNLGARSPSESDESSDVESIAAAPRGAWPVRRACRTAANQPCIMPADICDIDTAPKRGLPPPSSSDESLSESCWRRPYWPGALRRAISSHILAKRSVGGERLTSPKSRSSSSEESSSDRLPRTRSLPPSLSFLAVRGVSSSPSCSSSHMRLCFRNSCRNASVVRSRVDHWPPPVPSPE